MNPQLKPVLTDKEMQELIKAQVAKPVAPAQPAAPSVSQETPAAGLPEVISDADMNKMRGTAAPTAPAAPDVIAPQQKDGFLKTLIKDPIKTLLVKPAARTAEALGRTGIFGKTIKQGYEDMAEGGQDLKTIVGDYHVEGVKPGVAGVKQAAGEGLKAASYIYGGQGAGAVAKNITKNAFGAAVVKGATAGAASGGMYGGGQALEENKGVGDVVKDTAVGTAIGGLAGAAVPVAGALIKGGVKGVSAVRGASQRATEVAAKPQHIAEALRTGVDDNIVDFVTTAKPKDKGAFAKMFDMAKKGSTDLRYGQTDPYKSVAGETVLDRAKYLIKIKDLGRSQTERALNSLDQSPKDVSNVFMKFLTDLREKGVQVVKRGNGVQMTSLGKVPEGDVKFYKMMFDLLKPDNSGRVSRSYRGLHAARQRIFNELNLAKARQQPFSDDVIGYAENLRSELLKPIDAASKGKYKAAQQKTAEAMGALRDFVQLMGHKGDLEKLGTKDLRAAEVALRVLGNAKDRPMTTLMQVDDVAKKYGYKSQDSWLDQLMLADYLESIFGSSQTRSLRGQVGKAGMDVVNEATGALNEAANQNVLALGSRAVRAIIGKSKDDQIRALEKLLKTEAGSARPSTVFGRKK